MAQAGGTGSAFVVGTSTNAGAQFLGAMNAIRQANDVACTIPMPQPPSGEWIDYTKVSVTYSTGGGAPTALTWNASSACGASGGFYYDSDTNPSTILLCPTTCTTVQADATAKLELLLGCMLPSTGNPPSTDAGPSTPPTGDASACLLDGQSCSSGADCCSGSCNAQGYCGVVIK